MSIPGVGAVAFVGIVAGQFQLFATLPPAMLHADHAGDDVRRHARSDFDRALGVSTIIHSLFLTP